MQKTTIKSNDALIIEVLSDLLDNIKNLDSDISEWIDNNFWELI